ncbi:MAG: hypothetical protein UT66_C0013G0016 [candidate division CPR2 bacterium GW2011_GWC1_39_9]|uniref:HD domain-containing protein n=1 Tax=candidate division CPR2 bacterium GW2011_GWC2_39_10 TaxID=1618345 RepID=A0A0G0LT20_UNCC2|nr:MAG: hypothetical protein UT18_C0012G0024 [candidate division CPR2 bacterium GW2011_GWC2_39_10]KKR35044.1 MAG: hypothetical protein UT66_C0013G0016 [candidate division CPR2 bacterium GW2011_GWC1_39_9]
MIWDEAQRYFLSKLEGNSHVYKDLLLRHLKLVVNWGLIILKKHLEADKEITLTSIYLHDVGRLAIPKHEDHAVASEVMAREFLASQGYPPDKIERIAHCVRSHRCNDVQPETIEAKILAVADSASHLTDYAYLHLIHSGEKQYILEKLERDYRDIGLLPDIKKQLEPLYLAWEQLLKVFPDWKLEDIGDIV